MLRLIDMVRQAGRRLVVPLAGYPGVQLTQSTMKQNEFNAELQARSLYKLAERTLPDMVFTMMDLSVEAGSLGLPVRFPLAESATVEWHPVREIADIEQYKGIDPLYDGRVWVYLETVRLLKRKLDIPVGAYVIGPFTLAGLMMGANYIALSTIEHTELVRATVNFCEHVVVRYARALQDAGADLLCILDPTAVILSPQAYVEFAGNSVENVVRRLDTRVVLHVCGNCTHLLESMCRTGVQGVSLGAMVDLSEASRRIPPEVVIFGNLDPVRTLLQGDRRKVRQEAESAIRRMDGQENFILSSGCDLPAETPIENIVEMVRTAREL